MSILLVGEALSPCFQYIPRTGLIVNRQRLLRRLLQGHVANVSFSDLARLVESFGFRLARTSGSHRIYNRPGIPAQLNLQDVNGMAKPYQVRQFLTIIRRYDLHPENGEP